MGPGRNAEGPSRRVGRVGIGTLSRIVLAALPACSLFTPVGELSKNRGTRARKPRRPVNGTGTPTGVGRNGARKGNVREKRPKGYELFKGKIP